MSRPRVCFYTSLHLRSFAIRCDCLTIRIPYAEDLHCRVISGFVRVSLKYLGFNTHV
jgi:hypothetical protein